VILRALIACICSVVLFAPLAGASDAELTKIKVAFLPAEPAALVTYAKHRGMFTKQGIDAEMVPRPDPAVIIPALVSGDVQFSGTHLGLAALLKSRNAPVKVVAAGALYDPKHPTSALVAAKGRSIKRPRDLVGKTILIDSPNTIAHIGVLKWLKQGGVSPGDVKINFVLFPDMLASLAKGTVDAAFLPEPYLTQAVRQGSKIAAYPFDSVCSKRCLLTFWMARADQDSNLVARFRNAVQNAAAWANQPGNDAASSKILQKYIPKVDPKVLAKMGRTRFATHLRLSLAQPFLDAFIEFGVIPADFKVSDLVK
jgi:NitT/TauT family transport system substrate-binding protein